MNFLKSLKPQSRKLIVLLVSVVAYVANDLSGKPMSENSMMTLLALAGTYILAQGVADHGAQGAANAAKRAVKDGQEIAKAVGAVLAAKTKIEEPKK